MKKFSCLLTTQVPDDPGVFWPAHVHLADSPEAAAEAVLRVQGYEVLDCQLIDSAREGEWIFDVHCLDQHGEACDIGVWVHARLPPPGGSTSPRGK